MEVILEFLEEYYKQNAGENGKRKAWRINCNTYRHICSSSTLLLVTADKVHWAADEDSRQHGWTYYEPPVSIKTSPCIGHVVKCARTV